jgi:hypothetical protein
MAKSIAELLLNTVLYVRAAKNTHLGIYSRVKIV